MKIVKISVVVLVALLSIAAGSAKILQVPEEMGFLSGLGLSEMMILLFGVVQTAGGLLLVFRQTRLYGSLLVVIGFLVSAVLVFLGGNISFGLVSLLPAVLSAVVLHQLAKNARNKVIYAADA